MAESKDDLWDRIIAMPRPHDFVDFPRKDASGQPVGRLAMWILTQQEQDAAVAAADAYARRVLKDIPKDTEAKQGYRDLYDNAASVELLFRACRNADDLNRPFFPAAEALRRDLSTDEVGVLVTHYFSVQATLGPIAARMTSEEADAIVAKLIETGKRYPLDSLSPGALRTLAFSLAYRVRDLQTGKSLPGSLLVNTPSDSDPIADALES